MGSVNSVTLIGNLGADPDVVEFKNGGVKASLSMATSKFWTNKESGEKQSKTEWHNVEVFGNQAEAVEKYLSKGSQVCVQGSIETQTWEKDGETKYKTVVRADRVTFLGSKSDGGESRTRGPRTPF